MRIVVAGSAGQLGSTVTARLSPRFAVSALTRRDLDIADAAAVERVVASLAPDVVINCAAYNDVDGAEEDPQTALQVNAMAVLHLAQSAAARGALFVHYSTDFVFDGRASEPYTETAPTRPLSAYGLSKLLGEWLAREVPGAYVLRVESLFGGEPAKSSIDRILDGLRRGVPVRVFRDRVVTPSYVHDVAAATETILDRRPAAGVYHCVNSGATTWLELAQAAASLMASRTEIVPVSVHDVQLKAARPQYCALSNEKLRQAGIEMPSWRDALARHVRASSSAGVGLETGRA
jgi:dTDP-4-dehydrorhamnose reductase